MVTLYTDGSCYPNPGPGGWGALILNGDSSSPLSGNHPKTTNNRMELTAAIEGLKACRSFSAVHVITDSEYVFLGVTKYMAGWVVRNWMSSAWKPIKNVDLWHQLVFELGVHGRTVTWGWVKGHSDDPNNEIVDQLALFARERVTQQELEF